MPRAPAAAAETRFKQLTDSIDPAWVLEALSATGTASIRRRRLPAEMVVWVVLGMAIFREMSIATLVKHLGLAVPAQGRSTVADSAIAQARARLGSAPLKWLFETCARKWALASAAARSWRGLSVFGLDGTTLRVPDSPTNRAHFGSQSAGASRGTSGYPLVRLVTLMALRGHLLLAARFGPYNLSERKQARGLIGELPDNALVIADRNFAYARDLVPIERAGRNTHWLTRARKNHHWRRTRRLGVGDNLAEILVNRGSRRDCPWLPERWTVRVITYRRPGFRHQRLLTSLLDPVAYPAGEIRALYHERWEVELGFDEVKTVMLERNESIRSQSPDAVAQELWGLGVAYNLVRLEMERAADEAGVAPIRMSFKECLLEIRTGLLVMAAISPGNIPRQLRRLRMSLQENVLPKRRQRRYPRHVKIKMSNYPRNRPRRGRGRGAAK